MSRFTDLLDNKDDELLESLVSGETEAQLAFQRFRDRLARANSIIAERDQAQAALARWREQDKARDGEGWSRYSDRLTMERRYAAYRAITPGVLDCPFNVITFLGMAGYLRHPDHVPGHAEAREKYLAQEGTDAPTP